MFLDSEERFAKFSGGYNLAMLYVSNMLKHDIDETLI